MLSYAAFLSLSILPFVTSTTKLQEHYEWKILDYDFPTYADKVTALRNRQFIPENNLPVGIEAWGDKLFVTVPRWMEGIPATLNYVPLVSSHTKSPVLRPYPSWEANEIGNCKTGLTTVYRIHADICDRLWVLDAGTYGYDNTTTNLCPYSLNVYDLRTDTLIRKYQFRPEDTNVNTFIANIAVDVGKTCDDAHAYFSDELGYGLIVYSWEKNKSWRFTHGFFMPDPLAGDFNIGGLNFQWSTEGIFGMSLSPVQPSGNKILFFSPLASNRGFAVSTGILRNESKVDDSYHNFLALNERGPNSHTTARVMDDNGIEFFNLIDRNAVGCWNSALPYEPQNIAEVDKDDDALLFPSDVKVDRLGNLWVMSDRMSNFLLSSLDFSEVNFRVFFAPISVLIKGTTCGLWSH